MKQIYFLLFSFILVGHAAICQHKWGVKAGPNLSNQKINLEPAQPIENKNLLGYQLGVFYKVSLNAKWILASETNFSIVGAKYLYLTTNRSNPSSSSLITRYYANKVGYVEIPITVQRNFFKFYLGAGPSVSFKVLNPESNTRNVPTYKVIDVAGNLLTGYTITKKLDINARYSYGLINALKNESFYGDSYKAVFIRNHFANLSLLYTLK